jgi:Fe2+ transport system protein FeoA
MGCLAGLAALTPHLCRVRGASASLRRASRSRLKENPILRRFLSLGFLAFAVARIRLRPGRLAGAVPVGSLLQRGWRFQ